MQAKEKKQKRKAILYSNKKEFEVISPSQSESVPTDPVLVHFKNKEYEPTKKERDFCDFTKSLELSPLGIELFFLQTIKKKNYKDFISYNLSHLSELLLYGMEEDDETVLTRTINTFSLVAYQTSFVSAAALEIFLDIISPLFSYLAQKKSRTLTLNVNELLSKHFKEQYGKFINNPYQFFKSLSQTIIKTVEEDTFNKDTFCHLVESLLKKALWSVQDQKESWNSYLRLLKSIDTLSRTDGFSKKYFERLSWILTEQYCSFLELTGEQLSLKTVKEIKEELLKEPLLSLLPSQEKSIFSKRERLLEELLLQEAKKIFNEPEATTVISSNKL